MCARVGIPLPLADEYELWELGVACGVHLVETWQQHDERKVMIQAQEEWEKNQSQRERMLAEYAEKRRQRDAERRQRRREKVT